MRHEKRREPAGSALCRWTAHVRRMRPASGIALASAVFLLTSGAMLAVTGDEDPTLDETRLTMNKWIETQQIISKERNDWQQGKEILVGRLDLVRKEVTALKERIVEAEVSVAAADRKRDELQAESAALEAVGAQLTEAVAVMEAQVHRLHATMPEPIQSRIAPLYQRIPGQRTADQQGSDAAEASGGEASKPRVSIAERFQNVLGILNELNKANNEITVNYEVRTLGSGKPSEVRAVYVGLAQAWYVSANGEAGIGRPAAGGWQWEPSNAIAGDVQKTLEILQGKHSPEFVGLPVRIQ